MYIFRARLLFVSLTASLAVASCGLQESSVVGGDTSLDARTLPLTTGIQSSPEESQSYAIANNRLVAQCMRKKGFSFPAASPGKSADPFRFQFGPLHEADIDVIRSAGVPEPIPAEGEKKVIQPPGYLEALRGNAGERQQIKSATAGMVISPSSGCQGEADREIHGGLANVVETGKLKIDLQMRRAQAVARTEQHADFKGLHEKWEECMRHAGVAEPVMGTHGGNVENASKDLRCKTSTGLAGFIIKTWSRAEQDAASENPGLVTEYARLRDIRRKNIERILADRSAQE